MKTSSIPVAGENPRFDRFYPESETVKNVGLGFPGPTLSLWAIIRAHLDEAKRGDRGRESRLVNRLGQLRRNCPEGFKALPVTIREVVKEAVDWLRSVGRQVDFTSTDPRYWITQRGGAPRW